MIGRTVKYALVIVVVLALGGCTSEGNRRGGRKTTISVQMIGDSLQQKTYSEIARSYEELHPDVRIDLNCLIDAYSEKLNSRIASGTPPDVFLLHDTSYAEFVHKDILVDLRPYIQRSPKISLSDIFPVLVEQYMINGSIYGIPGNTTPMILYYNKDAFDEVGAQYPHEGWTWDDLLAVSKKLVKHDEEGRVTRYAIHINDWITRLMPFVWQNNGRFLNPDLKTCALNTPETIEAIKFYVSLITEHKVATSMASQEGEDVESMFMNGKLVMLINGFWEVRKFQSIKKFKWDVGPLPMRKSKATAYISDVLVIPKQSKHIKEAWGFIEHFLSEESQIKTGLTGVNLPARITSAEAVIEQSKGYMEHGAFFIETLEYARVMPTTTRWAEMLTGIFAPKFEAVLFGHKTVDQFCEEATEAINKLLSEK